MSDNAETAVLAGGCFWGVQDLLRHRDGSHLHPGRIHRWGERQPDLPEPSRHAEAVEIVFDPERISYRDILEFFFQIHDPTTKDRQGNDIGSSYRSEIFYTSDEQRQVAEDTIADVEPQACGPARWSPRSATPSRSGRPSPSTRTTSSAIPNGYTCHFPRPGWKLPHRQTAA